MAAATLIRRRINAYLTPISYMITLKILDMSFAATAKTGHDTGEVIRDHPPITRYEIAGLNFKHVEAPLMLSIWMLIACLAKIGFYISPKPSSFIPESCMLLLLGLFSGIVLYFCRIPGLNYQLSTSLFFLVLLPPIALDAGYFMPLRPFYENIGTILLLAIVGTIWNTLTLGFSLYGIAETGLFSWKIPLMHCLLFASLISAVDPVAILAVFEEAHVNEVLHIIVFGESLLNDGVAIVLYNLFGAFSEIGQKNIIRRDIINGVISFFVVALGGTLIGLIFGLLTGWLTKYTNKVKIIEPLFVFLLAYLSYVISDLFKLSGILAIVFCGMLMRRFVQANVSINSNITIKYSMKMISSICESIIFLFLGLSTVNDTHVWNTAFTLITLFLCFLFRTIGVLVLIPIANRKRLIKLTKVDMFIMIYGGLRGAIAFSLALLLDENVIGNQNKRMFVTTTTFVVIFTCFIQGITIRPLVDWLKVEKAKNKDTNMGTILFVRVLQHLMAGCEDIIGWQGKNRLRDKIELIHYKYLQPYLFRESRSREDRLLKICSKLNMAEASELLNKYGGDVQALKQDIKVSKKGLRPSIDLPVVDTSQLESEHARKISNRWHVVMDDVITKRRPTLRRFSKMDVGDGDETEENFESDAARLFKARPSLIPDLIDIIEVEEEGDGGSSPNRLDIRNTIRRYSTKFADSMIPSKMKNTHGQAKLSFSSVVHDAQQQNLNGKPVGGNFAQTNQGFTSSNTDINATPMKSGTLASPTIANATKSSNIPRIQINGEEEVEIGGFSEFSTKNNRELNDGNTDPSIKNKVSWKNVNLTGSPPQVMTEHFNRPSTIPTIKRNNGKLLESQGVSVNESSKSKGEDENTDL